MEGVFKETLRLIALIETLTTAKKYIYIRYIHTCAHTREHSCILKQQILRKKRDDKTAWWPTGGNKCFEARKNVITFCAARYQKTVRESKRGTTEVIEILGPEPGESIQLCASKIHVTPAA